MNDREMAGRALRDFHNHRTSPPLIPRYLNVRARRTGYFDQVLDTQDKFNSRFDKIGL